MSLIAFLACWCVQESNLHARWPQHTNKGLDAWSERLQRHWDPQQLCVTLPISSIITLGARRMDMTVCSRVRVRLIASLCASWCGDTPVVACVLIEPPRSMVQHDMLVPNELAHGCKAGCWCALSCLVVCLCSRSHSLCWQVHSRWPRSQQFGGCGHFWHAWVACSDVQWQK